MHFPSEKHVKSVKFFRLRRQLICLFIFLPHFLTKTFENKNGYLSQAFFKKIIVKKAQFVSGPFINMVFEILKKQKNKLKIVVGNVVTTISDNSNHLYRPV